MTHLDLAPILRVRGSVRLPGSKSISNRVLLLAARQAKETGCRFALCTLNAKVRRLFELGGFLELLPIAQTREEGLSAAR